MCYWNVSTFAGSGTAGWADGQGTAALFYGQHGISVDPATLNVYVGDWGNNRVRKISPSGFVSTFAGSGSGAFADGLGAAARFSQPFGIVFQVDGGNIFVADYDNLLIRRIR